MKFFFFLREHRKLDAGGYFEDERVGGNRDLDFSFCAFLYYFENVKIISSF